MKQRNRRQQKHSGRYHADNGAAHAAYHVSDGVAVDVAAEIAHSYQQQNYGYGNNKAGDRFYYRRYRSAHFAFGFFVLTRVRRKFFDIIVRAHFVNARHASAANHETARKQRHSRFFNHRLAFAGQQRFVYFRLSFQHYAVGAYLFAGIEYYDVVEHHFLGGNGEFFSVAYHQRRRSGNQL